MAPDKSLAHIPFEAFECFKEAVEEDDAEMVKTVLAVHPELVNAPVYVNSAQGAVRPLFLACTSMAHKVIEALLHARARHEGFVRSKTEWGRSAPLFWAIHNHKTDIAKLLIDGGVDLKVFHNVAYHPFHFAVFKMEFGIAQSILDTGYDVDTPTQLSSADSTKKSTALHAVCTGDQAAPVLWLLERGADLHVQNTWGQTPMEVAKENDESDQPLRALQSWVAKMTVSSTESFESVKPLGQ